MCIRYFIAFFNAKFSFWSANENRSLGREQFALPNYIVHHSIQVLNLNLAFVGVYGALP